MRKDGTRFWANVVITAALRRGGRAHRLRQGQPRPHRPPACRRSRCAPGRTSSRPPTASSSSSGASSRACATTRSSCSTRPATSCPGTPGARHLKGYDGRGDHRPALLGLLHAPRTARAPPGPRARVAVREGRYEEEGWRVRKDGTRFWASVTITAIRDEDGRLTGFAKVTRDLTSEREADRRAPRRARRAAGRQRGARPLRRRRGARPHGPAADDLGLRRAAGARRAARTQRTSTRGTSADSSQRLTRMLQGLLAYARAGRPVGERGARRSRPRRRRGARRPRGPDRASATLR